MSNQTEIPHEDQRSAIGQITRALLKEILLRTGIGGRDQRSKRYVCVRATFQVLDDIPATYKVGLFAKAATYDAIIRFLNGPKGEGPEPGPQSMAIKLIGVPGRKILPEQADAGTQDFVLIDGPISDSPLTKPFWSHAPYAFGPGDDTICRYSAVPNPENMSPPIPREAGDAESLRHAMAQHLTVAERQATFDFCVQIHTHAMPAVIGDPTVEWDTPIQRIAIITIPVQDFERPDLIRFGATLSYTPWHALPEHRPVGQFAKTRKNVFAASALGRHLANLVAEQEPTSIYSLDASRRSLGSIAQIAAVVVIVLGAAVAAAGVLASVTVAGLVTSPLPQNLPMPEYAAVEKQVWLNQQWGPGAREWFHHASQGAQLPTMISIPYEWFIALEQPRLSLGETGLLADQRYLDRLGFIPSTAEAGAFDWQSCREPEDANGYEGGAVSSSRRHPLPIGFACNDARTNPMLDSDRKPWLNPATGKTMSAVGLTCAACHTGRLTHGTTELLIDGGSAMIDVEKLELAIAYSLLYTQVVPFRFDRFARRVLGSEANNQTSAALRKQFEAVVKRLWAFNDVSKKVAQKSVIGGFGRLDMLNHIANQIFSTELGIEGNYAGNSAPVNYPHIWGAQWFSWTQYNGSIQQPMARNVGKALGAGAKVDLQGAPSGAASPAAPSFASTVQVGALFAMESLLAGNQPNAVVGFSGLTAPKWPEDLGPIDAKLAERGSRLYDDKCAHCHLPPTRSPAFWNAKNWTPPNASGQKYLRVNLIPLSEIGTDPSQAADMANRKIHIPPDLGVTSNVLVVAWEDVVAKTMDRWYDSQTPPVVQERRQEMNGFRQNQIRGPMAYKARPLDGIWATPPYLHNGSVPDIEALLSPVAERPRMFWVGSRAYDPVRLGYSPSVGMSGGFVFDTTQPGNFNTGHEFDDGPTRPGRIGRKLNPDERRALIEFLKTL